MEFSHIPVLKNETIELLNVKKDGVYVDGTLGGAGHSKAIQEKRGGIEYGDGQSGNLRGGYLLPAGGDQ